MLKDSIEEIAESTDMGGTIMRSYDPFGLTAQLPGNLLASESGGNEFRSADGKFGLLYVESAVPLDDYRKTIEWVAAVKGALTGTEFADMKLGFTGQPAFIAEISGSMHSEMAATSGVTLALVGGIFWICYRRIRPLLALLAALALTFLLAMATAGWLLADLTVISVGFASVMIGLSVDYGYFVFNQAAHLPLASLSFLRRRCLQSIVWTCSTTAAVFFALNTSNLPGLSQLGTLVGFGIVIGAGVMLGLFAPFARRSVNHPPLRTPVPVERIVTSERSLEGTALATAAMVVFLLTGAFVKPFPTIDFSAQTMRPKESGAYDTMNAIYERIVDDRGLLNLIVTGKTYEEVGQRLRLADQKLAHAIERGDLRSGMSASALWPNPEFQLRNLGKARSLSKEIPRLREAVIEAGFTDYAFKLTENVLGQWKTWADQPTPVWPQSTSSEWILRRLISRSDGDLVASGMAHPVPGHEGSLLDTFDDEGVYLVSWDQLGRELKQTVPRDLTTVIGLLFLAVTGLLTAALRNARSVIIFLLTMALSFLCLIGALSWMGHPIGLFSLAAVLLLLGTGADYTILPLLAIQRGKGDVPAAQRELTLVILLCSLSSIAGFGTLAFANNLALAELGRTCSIGLAIHACVSIFLLPVLLRAVGFGLLPSAKT